MLRVLTGVLCAAIALVPGIVRADILQCTDAEGVVHFTNIRPPGALGRRCRVVVRQQAPPAPAGGASRGSRDSSPDRYGRYDRHIREASRLYQLPEPFIRAVMKVESDFSPNVVSHAGAMGLMQLMPRTAAAMGVRDPFDPRQNILGGTRYLRILANMFNGDLVLTVAAYNAGEAAIMRYRGVPPYEETRRYVQRVLRHYYAFRAATPLAQR